MERTMKSGATWASRRSIDDEPRVPAPTCYIGGRRRWTLGVARQYLAELKGEPAPPAASDDGNLIDAKKFCEILGGVSYGWLWRRRSETQPAA
jgi:hypothetical protein